VHGQQSTSTEVFDLMLFFRLRWAVRYSCV